MVDDPTRGRVLLLAPESEPVLTRSGAEWMPNFIGLLQRKLTRIADPVRQTMVATGLIGALTALFSAYLDDRLPASREQFIDYCVDMLLGRAAVSERTLLLVGVLASAIGCCSAAAASSSAALASRPAGLAIDAPGWVSVA